jgi:hypothetical protein
MVIGIEREQWRGWSCCLNFASPFRLFVVNCILSTYCLLMGGIAPLFYAPAHTTTARATHNSMRCVTDNFDT